MTRLISEEIEPTFARIIGVMFARCESAQDENKLYHACNSFWWAVSGINRIAIAVRGEGEDGVHASIAASNEMRRVADYINHKIGINPLLTKSPDWP